MRKPAPIPQRTASSPAPRELPGMSPWMAQLKLRRLCHALLEDLRTGAIAQESARMERRRRKYEQRLAELLAVIEGNPA